MKAKLIMWAIFLLIAYGLFAYGSWQFSRWFNYKFEYQSLFEQAIEEKVKKECLKP